MSKFVLFFTQAESGAPGYLSQKGESDSLLFASSAFAFVQDSLEINLNTDLDKRITMVNALAKQASTNLKSAIQNAVAICPDVVLFCGESPLCKQTASAIATQFALPAIVDSRIDAFAKNGMSTTTKLQDFFDEIFTFNFESAKIVLVGTSIDALCHWTSTHSAEKSITLRTLLQNAQGLPAVTCGYDTDWIFDF